MTWTQKNHDHLVMELRKAELLASNIANRRTKTTRRNLNEKLREQLNRIREIEQAAQNTADTLDRAIAWNENQ